jgi:hypothetical protein
MDLKGRLRGCFGSMDAIFALHPNDEGRALKLLVDCHKNHVSLADVQAAVAEYLKRRGSRSEHIRKQQTRVRQHFGPWLR